MIVSNFAPTQPAAAPTRQPVVEDQPHYRPPIDWWQIGDERLSTDEILQDGLLPAEGVWASYHYKLEEGSDSDQPRNVLASIAAGAAMGGGIGFAGAGALAIVGEFMSLLLSGPYYRGSGIGTGFLIGGAVVGAVLGGIAGGAGSFEPGRAEDELGVSVRGTLRSELQADGSTNVAFYPGSSVTNRIDVNQYAEAEELPEVEAERKPAWLDALKGAGIGAAAIPAQVVPLLGVFLPAYLAGTAGTSLAGGETYGSVLGGAAGLGVTAGSIYALNNFGGWGVAAVAGATAVAGGLLGPSVFSAMRQQEAELAQLEGQWWHRSATSPY